MEIYEVKCVGVQVKESSLFICLRRRKACVVKETKEVNVIRVRHVFISCVCNRTVTHFLTLLITHLVHFFEHLFMQAFKMPNRRRFYFKIVTSYV